MACWCRSGPPLVQDGNLPLRLALQHQAGQEIVEALLHKKTGSGERSGYGTNRVLFLIGNRVCMCLPILYKSLTFCKLPIIALSHCSVLITLLTSSCTGWKSSAELGTAASGWAGNSGSTAAWIPDSSERSGCGTIQELFLTGNRVCVYLSNNINTI